MSRCASAIPEIINEFNVAGLVDNAIETLRQGLLLKFKPVNLDVLPLYIVLMGLFPPVLWMMLRQPNLTMLASIALWLVARQFGWNLPAYPAGTWYFNPYCWQVLFVFGSWCALGGARRVALDHQCAGHAVFLHRLSHPRAGHDDGRASFRISARCSRTGSMTTFNPNDKTNLAPYRFLHFVVIVIMVIRFVPKDWPGLEWKMFDPVVVCGQQSLAVFCVGVFLSFVGHFELMMSSGSLFAQIFVSVTGIAIMTIVAYYISWSKRQDKPLPKRGRRPKRVRTRGVPACVTTP